MNCGPRGLQGEPDHLFHNNGDGTFTDVTAKAGVEDKDRYYGFTSIFVDINGNGKPDLVVGNDSEPNYLYINKGDGTFDDQSYVSGFALNKDGREIASMGIAAGDYENNGLIDFFVTDFGDDYKVLFHNDGDASFTDVSYKAGIAQTTIPFVGWGDGFLDYDNDGWLDLFQVNGHVYPEVDQHDWGTTFAERPLLFHNVPDGPKGRKFEYVPPVKGTGLADVIPGARRGLWRSVQRRQDRCDHQSHRRPAGAAAQRESRSSSLGGDEAGGRTTGTARSPRDATCATVYLQGQRHAQRQDVLCQRQLHFGQRSAAALRPGRRDRCRNGRDSLALGREGDGEAARGGSHLHHHGRPRGSPALYAAANRVRIPRRLTLPTANNSAREAVSDVDGLAESRLDCALHEEITCRSCIPVLARSLSPISESAIAYLVILALRALARSKSFQALAQQPDRCSQPQSGMGGISSAGTFAPGL